MGRMKTRRSNQAAKLALATALINLIAGLLKLVTQLFEQ